MWIIEAPSSTTLRASAAYSSGVYGIAGHWSRFATVPEIELVMITGSSKRLTPASPPGRSYGHHAVLLPGSFHALALGHLERADHDRPRLARVDDVVDHVVARRDVRVDDLSEAL